MAERNRIPIKECQKFKTFKSEPDTEHAVTYMSLRSKGCPSRTALHFCSKSVCRHDSTKQRDGPTCFRVLRPKHTPNIQINGWSLTTPKYDLTPFHQNHTELLTDDGQEEMLQKHFIMNEDKGRETFKKKIASLAKYYRDLNLEFKFADLPKKILMKKLRENKQKTTEERMRKKHYFLKSYL